MNSLKEKDKAGSILGIRWGGLGDLLVIFPSVQLLRLTFPRAKITLLSRLAYANLFKSCGLISEIISPEDYRATLIFQEVAESREEWFEGFDKVICWLNTPQPALEKIMRKKIKDKFMGIIANEKAQISLPRQFFQKTAEVFGIQVQDDSVYKRCAHLPIQPEWEIRAREVFPWLSWKKFVVIHPGSGGLAKRWDLDYFLWIMNRLASSGIGGTMVTGPAEEDYLPKFFPFPWPRGWGWGHEPSLEELSWLLSKAAVYVGNDSGVTHLAGLCGCAGVALFRREKEALWHPPGNIRVIRANSLQDIGKEIVWQEIENILKSSGNSPLTD